MTSGIVEITDGDVRGIQISGGTAVFKERTKGSLAVKLYIDDHKICKLGLLNNDLTLRWELDLPVTLKYGSRLRIQLVHRRSYGVMWKTRADASMTFKDCHRLLSANPEESKELKLNDDPLVTINVLAQIPSTLQTIVNSGVEVSKQTKAVLDHLGRAREFVQTIMEFGAIASEAHPIAKAIFGCINIVYQKLENQAQSNQLILDLAKDMADAMGYIEDVEQFARLAQLKQAIKDVKPLIEDTTNFIVKYTFDDAALRLLEGQSTREQIDGLTDRFSRFKQQFDRGVSVQSAATLETLLKDMASSKDDRLIDELKPQDSVRGRPTAGWTDGTRKEIMDEIEKWVDGPESPNILWLNGFPGVGKSAIVRKLVTNLKSSHRLGSSFFFQRELSSVQTPAALWRTVAFDLARQYPSARNAIVTKLKDDEVDLEIADADELFLSLVEEPLKYSTNIPPGRLPVIVIDAVDECGGFDGSQSKHRSVLLRGLKAWTRLPSQFKMVVTSRPEGDIFKTLSPVSYPIELASGMKVSASSSRDIHLFLSREFYRIAENYEFLSPTWPGAEAIREYTKRSAGLFIYADTLIKFVDEGQPVEQLQRVLRDTVDHENLTNLYGHILSVSFKDPSTTVLEEFRKVTGTIILAKTPLRRQDVSDLLGIGRIDLEYICQRLRSVLDAGDVLRFTHQSFADFLVSSHGCPPQFQFHKANQSHTLVLESLRVMECLRFNICNIETSYVTNDNIPDLELRVHDNISAHLQYACCFWTDHIRATDFSVKIAQKVENFMTTKLLNWLEVLSLLRKVNSVKDGLASVIAWSKAHRDDIADFMTDATKFVVAFATLIVQSVPHIYLSAIPFSPKGSKVAEMFRLQYKKTLSVVNGKATNWPAIQNILRGHSGSIGCVAFSPDGRRIVSGSADTTIRVWDAETGDAIFEPLKDYGGLTCVAFSPDGNYIVSASYDGDICIWDADTGDAISVLDAHSDIILTVVFSPDGKRIVSGSYDNTIRSWDVETCDAIFEPLEGHAGHVKSVAFSPDGKRIVSGSEDNTIRLWDADTGDDIGEPFKGHSAAVYAVAFLPDGKHILSSSCDKTIRVWDTNTGNSISKPLEEPNNFVYIYSLAFSLDGKRMVSASGFDPMICLWDTETGGAIFEPLKGHSDTVSTVAFSPDGKRVVSGSSDNTICLWDAETDDAISKPLQGHRDTVRSVAFSPDGKRIVSGSGDVSVHLWDAETGGAISWEIPGPWSDVHCVAFSPDGKCVMSAQGHSIMVWDADTGVAISEFKGHGNVIHSIAFSRDGKRLVSGSADNTIRLWDTETGDSIYKRNPPPYKPIHSVAFSRDGKRFVSGSEDKTVCVWDAEKGIAISKPFEGHSGTVHSVMFSSDGKRIVSGSDDMTICLWDVETGDAIRTLEGHSGAVYSVAFSPDDKHILSGSADSTVRFWNPESGDIISKPLRGHSGCVHSVAFSPDGKRFVTGSNDKSIRIWDADVAEVSTSSFADDSRLLPSGWVVNSDSEKLFWVPPWNRAGLCWPRTTTAISRDGASTNLDLSQFLHGTGWQQCVDG